MRAFFGILGLAGAGFLISSVSTVGCGSSGGSTGTAGTGSPGSAGTTGSAGTQGQGGSGGSGGSGGGGGGTAPSGCAISDLAPGDTGAAYTITDFSSVDAGTLTIPIGGTFTYASPIGAVAPTATVANGAWHITLNAPGMASAPQYIGVGIYFNGNADGTDCVDATAHTGVKFDLTGTIGGMGCTAQYSTNDSEHSDAVANMNDKKASGPSGAYAPQATLTVPTGSSTVMMPFMGTGAPAGGSPATAINKMRLTGVQWQFTVPAGATMGCMVDIMIDNVGFY